MAVGGLQWTNPSVYIKGMKIKVTIKELLLLAGILAALAAVLLFWREMPPFDRSFAPASYHQLIPSDLELLVSKTFAVLR